jgi:hypothetical protein
LLANSTLIDKASHSSHKLSLTNVRGSFLGTNIIRHLEGLENEPGNFDALFARHRAVGFEKNLVRIVERTSAIQARRGKFSPTDNERAVFLAAADFAALLSAEQDYLALGRTLAQSVQDHREAILLAARNNPKIRGDRIEQIITKAASLHRAEDLVAELACGATVYIDIKTKLVGHSSNPKASNIDKLLRILAAGNAAFSFLFLLINLSSREISTRMVSCLDTTILKATGTQRHWAARDSRGSTQLKGNLLSPIFAQGFNESIEVSTAQDFLKRLLAM